MAETKMQELARKLLGQSKEDKVDWEDSGRRGSFRVIQGHSGSFSPMSL